MCVCVCVQMATSVSRSISTGSGAGSGSGGSSGGGGPSGLLFDETRPLESLLLALGAAKYQVKYTDVECATIKYISTALMISTS